MSPRIALFLVLLTLVALGPSVSSLSVAHAYGPERLPKLATLIDEVARGGMPLGYVPLRKLWSEWDQGNPSEVEASLEAVSSDARVAPPLRAYAGLLGAYARRRRGDLAGAKARVKDLGFVSRWIVTGPFDNEGKSGFDRIFGPEEQLGEPLSMAQSFDGKERAVRHRLVPDVFPYAWVDLGAIVRPQENVCAYATTFVRSRHAQKGPQPLSIWFGSAGAAKVFFDGKLILKDTKYRQLDEDRFGATLTMHEGWHRLTVKVCGNDNPPMFALRLAGASGAPDANLESDPDPSHASEAAAVRFKKGESNTPPTLSGPAVAFEKLVASDNPASLEAFAGGSS